MPLYETLEQKQQRIIERIRNEVVIPAKSRFDNTNKDNLKVIGKYGDDEKGFRLAGSDDIWRWNNRCDKVELCFDDEFRKLVKEVFGDYYDIKYIYCSGTLGHGIRFYSLIIP